MFTAAVVSVVFGLISVGVSVYSLIDANNKYEESKNLANSQFDKSMAVTEAMSKANNEVIARQEAANRKMGDENARYLRDQEKEYLEQKRENKRLLDNAHTVYGNPEIKGRM